MGAVKTTEVFVCLGRECKVGIEVNKGSEGDCKNPRYRREGWCCKENCMAATTSSAVCGTFTLLRMAAANTKKRRLEVVRGPLGSRSVTRNCVSLDTQQNNDDTFQGSAVHELQETFSQRAAKRAFTVLSFVRNHLLAMLRQPLSRALKDAVACFAQSRAADSPKRSCKKRHVCLNLPISRTPHRAAISNSTSSHSSFSGGPFPGRTSGSRSPRPREHPWPMAGACVSVALGCTSRSECVGHVSNISEFDILEFP